LEAAERNSIDAMFELALIYLEKGWRTEAVKWLTKSGKLGFLKSQRLLGQILENEAEAIFWTTKAAEGGDVEAQQELKSRDLLTLGLAYLQGRGVEKNASIALDLFEQAAVLGNAEALYQSGLLYLKGEGTVINPSRAFSCFQASSSHPPAIYMLGSCYENGVGVDKNVEEALECFQRGADQQNQACLLRLGKLYLRAGDVKAAIDCLERAGDSGEALHQLSEFYILGTYGVEKNEKKGLKYLDQAVELNYPPSLNFMGEILMEGNDEIDDDLEKAQKLFIKADLLGDEKAAANLVKVNHQLESCIVA
jgi:TPR repeat protein